MFFFRQSGLAQLTLDSDFVETLGLPKLDSHELASAINRRLDPLDIDYAERFAAMLTGLSPESAGDFWLKWLEHCGCDEAGALRRAVTALHDDKNGRLAALLHSFCVHTPTERIFEIKSRAVNEKRYVQDPLALGLLNELAWAPVEIGEETAIGPHELPLFLSCCCPGFKSSFDWRLFGRILNTVFARSWTKADTRTFERFAARLRAQTELDKGYPEHLAGEIRNLFPTDPDAREALCGVFEALAPAGEKADMVFFFHMLCERLDIILLDLALREQDPSFAEALAEKISKTLPAQGSPLSSSRVRREYVFDYFNLSRLLNSGTYGGPYEKVRSSFKNLPPWTFISENTEKLIRRLEFTCPEIFRFSPSELAARIKKRDRVVRDLSKAQKDFIIRAASDDKVFNSIVDWNGYDEDGAREIISCAGPAGAYRAAFNHSAELAGILCRKTAQCRCKFMRKEVFSSLGTEEWYEAGGYRQFDGCGCHKYGLTRIAGLYGEAVAEGWLAPDTDLDRLLSEVVRRRAPIDKTPEAGALPFMTALGRKAYPARETFSAEILRVGLDVIMKHAAQRRDWALDAYVCALHLDVDTRRAALAMIGTPEWKKAGGRSLHRRQVQFVTQTLGKDFSILADLADAREAGLIPDDRFFECVDRYTDWPQYKDRLPSEMLLAAGDNVTDARLCLHCIGVENILKAIADGSEKDASAYRKCFELGDSKLLHDACLAIGSDLWTRAGGLGLYKNRAGGRRKATVCYETNLSDHVIAAMGFSESDKERAGLVELVKSAHACKCIDDFSLGTFMARAYVLFGILVEESDTYVTRHVWENLPKCDGSCKAATLRKLARRKAFPWKHLQS